MADAPATAATAAPPPPPPAAMDAFMRLKVVLSGVEKGPGLQKMMAVAGTTRWSAFRSAAAVKFGHPAQGEGDAVEVPSSVKFLWEGCCIEEPDDKYISAFLKDGDTLLMTTVADQAAASCMEVVAMHDDASNAAEVRERSSGPASKDASTSGDASNGRLPPTTLPRSLHAAKLTVGPPKVLLDTKDASHTEPPEEEPRDAHRASSSITAHEKPRSTSSMQSLPPLPRPVQQSDSSLIRQGSGSDVDKKCTCKHSKCVKLYCICWSAGVLCNSCLCQDCFNRPENEDFIRAEQSRIRSRNPLAFSGKVEQGRDGEVSHKIGCRCRRSQCIKKYCECFDGGVRCSSNCRCSDCYNKPDGPEGEEGGLASLASAAQMATECMAEQAAFHLTPGTAAAVAPYHMMGKSLAHGMMMGALPDAGSAELGPPWPNKPAQRLRQVSDGEDGGGGELAGGGKKRRSSSNSSSGVLSRSFAPMGHMEEKFGNRFPDGSQADRVPGPPAWHDSMAWAGPQSGAAADQAAPPHHASHQAGSDGDSEGGGRDGTVHCGPSAAPARLAAPPRPTARHAERAWSGPPPQQQAKMHGSSAMQSGGSILQHLQQQQHQMEAFLLHQQQAATMMAMSGAAEMGMGGYQSLPMTRPGYNYVMCPPHGPGGLIMLPMLSSAGSMSSQGTGLALPSPHALVEDEPTAHA